MRAAIKNALDYVLPVQGGRVSSEFGERIHPIYKTKKIHNGIDFAVPERAPIYATQSGYVGRVLYNNKEAGNALQIYHFDGNSSKYLHLHGFAPGIGKGTRVRKGQLVGYAGNTGRSTGPHLHCEIGRDFRWFGPRINPRLVLEEDSEFKRSQYVKLQLILDSLRKEEGGLWADDPIGGRTFAGITQKDYNANMKSKHFAEGMWEGFPRDVADLNGDQIDHYYLHTMIFFYGVDRLPTPLAVVGAHMVNGLPSRALKVLQRNVKIKADGVPGSDTRNAFSELEGLDAASQMRIADAMVNDWLYDRRNAKYINSYKSRFARVMESIDGTKRTKAQEVDALIASLAAGTPPGSESGDQWA